MSKDRPKRILVIRFGAIGDIVLTFPAIKALKKAWPDTHITYLTKAKFAPLVHSQGFIDDVLSLDSGEGIASVRAKVTKGMFDGIIDLHVQLRSRAIRTFNSVPTLAKKKPRTLWESGSVRLGWAQHRPKVKIVENHHRIMDAVTQRELPREQLCFDVSNDQKLAAKERLARLGFNFDQLTRGISPGANWFTKQWPIEKYAEVAKIKTHGYQILAVGSPVEIELAKN